MLSSGRALRLASKTGTALRQVPEMEFLHQQGIELRRGELVMLASYPASGKSTLALWWAIKCEASTLYISPDMSPHTATSRVAAMLTGHTYQGIVRDIADDGPALDFYASEISTVSIQWAFTPNPTLPAIRRELDAYVEVWDAWPDLIVVDNLMDVEAGGEDHGPQQWVLKELKALARDTGACVLVLHHCREQNDTNLHHPPPRWAIQNKLDQSPSLILTVAISKEGDKYRIAPTKVRDGKQYPDGKTWWSLACDLSRCQFSKLSLYAEGSRNA